MKKAKLILTLSILLASNYATVMDAEIACAENLYIENKQGNDYLVESGGVYSFLDAGGQSYKNITYIKNSLNCSDVIFLRGRDRNIDVLADSLTIKDSDHTCDTIFSENNIINLGKEEKPIGSISISGNVLSRPGQVVAGSNSVINLWANNIKAEADNNVAGHKMLFTTDVYAQNAAVNINANNKISIAGNIGVGFLGNECVFGAYSGSRNGKITVGTLSNGTVNIDGDIYTANIAAQGTEYRGNSIEVELKDKQSYIKGKIIDYYIGVERDKNRKEGTRLTLTNGSTWKMTGSSYVSDLLLDQGSSINMSWEDAANPKKDFRILRVYNDMNGEGGIINMDIDASAENKSDRIFVTGTHTGTHYITLNNVGDSTDGAAATILASVADEQGEFKAKDSEGTLYWNKYTLAKNTNDVTKGFTVDWVLAKAEKISEKLTTGAATVLSSNALNYHTWRTENDKLLQRMGELRLSGGEEHGAWFRIGGSKIGRDGSFAFDNKYTAYELGYDTQINNDSAKTIYQGVALGYLDGQSNYARGSGANSGRSISFYNTELSGKGHYLDLIFKISNMKNDFTVYDTNNKKISGAFHNTGVAASAEYGRRQDLSAGWYIEPQAQLTLGYLGGDTYKTSSGIEVKQGGIKSAVGRAGVNIGRKIGGKGIIYAKANMLHEFGGGYNVAMSDAKDTLEAMDAFNDTWFEYGLGVAFKTGASSIYFDAERSTGGGFYKNWRWNAGVNWSF